MVEHSVEHVIKVSVFDYLVKLYEESDNETRDSS